MSEEKKYLDIEGVKILHRELSMDDYPNNETLVAVINAIDETKADANSVLFKIAQTLTEEEKQQVALNLKPYTWYKASRYDSPNSSLYTYYISEGNAHTFDIESGLQLDCPVNGTIYGSAVWDIAFAVGFVVSTQPSVNVNSWGRIIDAYELMVNSGIEFVNANNKMQLVFTNNLTTSDSGVMAIGIWQNEITEGANAGTTHIISIPENYKGYQTGTIYWNNTDRVVVSSTYGRQFRDTTLSKVNYYADAKAVGDALATKADKADLVQSDWQEADETSLSYIKNKPDFDSLELITAEDIDTICGSSIVSASEVTF